MEKHVTQKNPLKKREERDKKENQKKKHEFENKKNKMQRLPFIVHWKKNKNKRTLLSLLHDDQKRRPDASV